MDGFYDAGRSAWPELRLSEDVFGTFLSQHKTDEPPSLERAPDLFLVCACLTGVPGAVEIFDRAHVRALRGALTTVDVRGHDREDLLQLVREQLLVGSEDEPPLLSEYAGRGPLSRWLRIVAVRRAQKVDRGERRRTAREHASESRHGLDLAQLDPELVHLKQAYVREFKEAFEAAVGGLSSRSAGLLRQSVVHKLTSRQIGALYGVHHATAARWVTVAREELVQGTHEELAKRLAIEKGTLDEILALIRSQVDLTVSRILK